MPFLIQTLAEPGKRFIGLEEASNRIGQGIEFGYCCLHACFAFRDAGFETFMINSNPETVSTDYDTADRLYFEPLTLEDVIGVLEAEKADGVIIQFGGQTPLKLAVALEEYLNSEEARQAGLKTRIVGTPPDSIDAAEDRDRFMAIFGRDEHSLRSRLLGRMKKRHELRRKSVTQLWSGLVVYWVGAEWRLCIMNRSWSGTCCRML